MHSVHSHYAKLLKKCYTVYHSKKKTIPCEAQREEFTLNSRDSRDSRVPSNSRSLQGMSSIDVQSYFCQILYCVVLMWFLSRCDS